MRIILHIGTHKTGTSSIQNVCHKMRTTLMEQGILYPTITPYNRHSILVTPYVEKLPREFARHFNKNKALGNTFANRMWKEIKNEISENIELHTIILSSEHFANVVDVSGFLDQVHNIAPNCEIDILCYLRRPDDRYLSGIQQKLKGTYKLNWPQNEDLLPDLHKWDGAGRLILKEFNRSNLLDGDVVSDFLDCIGAKISRQAWAHLGSENISLSAEAMAAVINYRKNILPHENGLMSPEVNRLIKIMRNVSTSLPKHLQPKKPQLKPEIRLAALVATQKRLATLRDDFGFTFSDKTLYDFEKITDEFSKTDLLQSKQPQLHHLIDYDPDKLVALHSATIAHILRKKIKKKKENSKNDVQIGKIA